ncbi:MAG: Ku protein, partial [Candidatus Angelobacter sp.]
VGVAKIAMHNREHIVILRPGARGITLHTMYYVDEIRQVEEFRTDTSAVKEKELDLAKTLIESLLAPFEPDKYKDDYRENLKAMIQAKIEGKQIVEPAAPTHKAPVIDILEALKMSLAEGKKPPRSVREASIDAAPSGGNVDSAKKRGRKTSGGD